MDLSPLQFHVLSVALCAGRKRGGCDDERWKVREFITWWSAICSRLTIYFYFVFSATELVAKIVARQVVEQHLDVSSINSS